MRVNFDIVGSFNKQKYRGIDSEKNVNLFEFNDPDGKNTKALLPTAGLTLIKTFGLTGTFRGSLVYLGLAYFAVGDTFYSWDGVADPIDIGTIGTSTGYVGMEGNLLATGQVVLVDGAKGYLWEIGTSTFGEITDPGFPAQPIDIAFMDGFFIVPSGGTNLFAISASNDGSSWDALNSAAITTHPGHIAAVQVLHRRIFIFGVSYCEVWENQGLTDFPFRRNNSMLMEYGTISPASVISGFDKLFFLSQDQDGLGHVIMVTGSTAIRVSTQALDAEIETYAAAGQIADAQGMLYQNRGIIFYRLNFTAANKTWVYNVTQSTPAQSASGEGGDLRWHNEEMINESRHVAQVTAYLNGKTYFGSYLDNKLYLVDNDNYTNNGENIKRERITKQFFDPTYNRVRVDRLYLDLVQGEAASNGVDATPIVFLDVSKDGGRTWAFSQEQSMGKIGERLALTRFRKIGVARTHTYRIRFYNGIVFLLLGASIDYTVLPE